MTTAQNSPHHGRRKFLVKSSSLALITSLPLKSSWAAGECDGTVSGNLSGNTSSVACNTTVSGISPDTWKTIATTTELNTVWSAVFASTSKGTYRRGNNGIFISDPTLENILNGLDVYDRYLVAGYLNALNGHYPLAEGVNAVTYAQILEEEAQVREADVLNALELTWT